MKTLFFFVLLFLSLLIELLAGSLGLPLFLSALVIYYLALVGPAAAAFYLAILLGVVLDLSYGRELPATAVVLTAALATGRLMHLKAPVHSFETALPGMGVILTALIGDALTNFALSRQPESLGLFFWKLIFFGALGLFLMPLLTLSLDAVAGKLGIPGALREPKSTFDRLRPRRVREPRTRRLP